MKVFLIFSQGFSAILLIIAILLHQPTGEGLGGIGGQARVYQHKSHMESGLNKITVVITVFFLVVSILLSILS